MIDINPNTKSSLRASSFRNRGTIIVTQTLGGRGAPGAFSETTRFHNSVAINAVRLRPTGGDRALKACPTLLGVCYGFLRARVGLLPRALIPQ